MIEVRAVTGRSDVADVVRVMAAAFDDDPVTRWLLPTGSLTRLFTAHARWSHTAPGCTDLAVLDGEPVGAAFWDPPGFRVPALRQVAALPAYVRALGRNVGRGAVLEGAMHQARPLHEFWYLAGVGAIRRGEGIGSALIRHRLDQVTGPTYLESSKRENVPLYERFGFERREALQIVGGPELWPMLRTG